jgi:two-component system sensor histidine kinase MtrB
VNLRRRPSLWLRIGALVALAVSASTITLAVVAYELADRGSRDRFVETSIRSARSDFLQAAEVARKVPSRDRPAAIRDYAEQRGVVWRMNPIPSGGEGCVDDRFPPGMDSITTPGELRHAWVRLCNGHRTLAVFGSPINGISLTEFFDYEPVRDQAAHLRHVLVWVGLGGLAVASIVGVVVGGQVSRPIRRVAVTARALGDDLDVRMPPARKREVRELAELGDAFNDMAGRLQSAQDQQRRFVADVAHELRTPLAAMLASAEAMASHDASRRARSTQLLTEQTRRLTSLVGDLLEISRFDAHQAELNVEYADLGRLARDAVDVVATDSSIEVVVIGDPVAGVDPPRVHAIVRNLVANAVQHGASPIEVVVDGSGADVSITVLDHGPGVPPDLAAVVFERFARGDTARSTEEGRGSTGLGLAIARENAALHGGSVSLDSGETIRFTLRLPRRAGTGDEQPVQEGLLPEAPRARRREAPAQ